MKSTIRRILKEEMDNHITKVILDTINEYNMDPYDINNGLCESFTMDVINKMGVYKDNLYELSDDMIVNFRDPDVLDYWDGELIETPYGVWSKNMLDMYGYPHIPLKDIKEEFNHVWIYYNGKHYDAEEPYGVNDWTQLPMIKRQLNLYNRRIN